MMMPATLSVIRLSFGDDKERALAIGIWASVASGGAAFGPVVGGRCWSISGGVRCS
jgi:DHA2 family multidrug resistance protein-like MFS transporter